MSFGIDPTVFKPAMKNIEEIISAIDAEKEIPVILANASGLAMKVRAVAELFDTPELVFTSYLIWDQLSMTQKAYDAKNEEWYHVNSDALKEFRTFFKEYLVCLKDALQNQKYRDVLEGTKAYFYRMNHNIEKLTSAAKK